MSGADFTARALALDGFAKVGSAETAKGGMLVGHRSSAPLSAGRKVSEKLDDLISVKDFGAKGDGVTDDTAAIRAAIRATLTRSPLFSGFRAPTGCLYFPEGVYRITENGVLSDLTATKRRGMTLRGAGKTNSILWIDASALAGETWFYDNAGTQRQWGMTFEGLGFSGGSEWRDANPATDAGTNGPTNISTNVKGFKLTGPGWESGFQFIDCRFAYLSLVFHLAGSNNADTHTFTGCEVLKTTDVTLIDNPQAFNVTWRDCYLNQIYGDTLRFGSNANGGGGNFLMDGGAVIAHEAGEDVPHYVVRMVDGGPSLANAPVAFNNVRFELRGNYHGFANVASGQNIVTASKCSFWNTGTIAKNFVTAAQYGMVRFEGCSLAGNANGYFFIIIGTGRLGKNATVSFTDSCILPAPIIQTHANISWTGANGGRLFIDNTCVNASTFLDTTSPAIQSYACDIYGKPDGTQISNAANTANRTRTRYSVNAFKSASNMAGAAGLSGSSVGIPPYSRIVEVWVKIEPGIGGGNNVRCLIGNDDKSVVYAETTVGPQNGGHYAVAQLHLPVGTDANKQVIRFWFDNGSGGNSTASSVIRVDGGVVYE